MPRADIGRVRGALADLAREQGWASRRPRSSGGTCPFHLTHLDLSKWFPPSQQGGGWAAQLPGLRPRAEGERADALRWLSLHIAAPDALRLPSRSAFGESDGSPVGPCIAKIAAPSAAEAAVRRRLHGATAMRLEMALAPWRPHLLSLLRLAAGLLMLQHGTAKVLKFPLVQSMAKVSLATPQACRRHPRAGWRSPVGNRPVHAAARLHSLGQGGGGRFRGPRRAQLLPDPQRRRARGPLLLRVPLPRRRRRRAMEH